MKGVLSVSIEVIVDEHFLAGAVLESACGCGDESLLFGFCVVGEYCEGCDHDECDGEGLVFGHVIIDSKF